MRSIRRDRRVRNESDHRAVEKGSDAGPDKTALNRPAQTPDCSNAIIRDDEAFFRTRTDGLRMRFHTEPDMDWKNIFELWKENGERVPFRVAKSTWSAEAGHFLIVGKVEVRKWPYGAAWGHYHWNGRPSERGKIQAAGTYNWRLLNPQDQEVKKTT